MTRHASADKLALLAAGELRRRTAARVSAHVAGCTRCARARADLAAVSDMLAAAPYPSLPDNVSVRIELALRAEASNRLAAAPATEAGRRELPVSSRRERAVATVRGWQLPGLSVRATRLVTAAGALVLIGGGYLVASNLPSGVRPGSPPAATAQPMTAGPNVTYGKPGSQRTVHSVHSTTDFVPAQLRNQALSAYREATLRGEAGTLPSGGTSAPNASRLHSLASPLQSVSPPGTGSPSKLAGCVQALVDGRSVVLIDLARYEGKPATIFVLGATPRSPAEVIVTSDACSAAAPDVLARASLGQL